MYLHVAAGVASFMIVIRVLLCMLCGLFLVGILCYGGATRHLHFLKIRYLVNTHDSRISMHSVFKYILSRLFNCIVHGFQVMRDFSNSI
jgi:hypothetical protein